MDNIKIYERKHCNSTVGLDFTGRLMVLKIDSLKEYYHHSRFQLFLCQSGFGCSPTKTGRKVFGKFLIDDESCCFDRGDFLGELKTEYIPKWALDKMNKSDISK